MAGDALLFRSLRPILTIACCLSVVPWLLAPAFGATETGIVGRTGIGSAPTGIVNGTVKDALGNLIEGAEILIAGDSQSMLPLARVRTDSQGQFRLPSLAVGSYRFAALKDGYRTAVGTFQTGIQPWFEVILHPMPRAEEILSRLPQDADWVLRVPRRSIFRQIDAPRPVLRDAAAPRNVPAIADQLTLQFRHQMAWNETPGSPEEPGAEAATATHLRVASAVGQRGQLSLVGSRDRDAAPMLRDGPGDRDSAGVAIDFEYAATPDTQMRIEAFYRSEDFRVDDAIGATPSAPVQADRTWGYGSEWTVQLDASSRVDVRLDYQDRNIESGMQSWSIGDKVGFGTSEAAISQRAVRASGSYSSAAVAGHQLQVGLRAQHLDSPLDDRSGSVGALGAPVGIAGWSVVLDAEDRWAVSAPFTLIYGLGYKHAVDPVDTSLVVPRLGGRLAVDPIAVGFAVSYHAVSTWEGEDSLALWSSPLESDGRVGYTLDTEIPLVGALSIRGAASYTPVQLDAANSVWNPSAWAERPLYRTDGNAEVHETSIGLHRDSATARTYAEFSSGTADGMVNAVRPQQDLFSWLTPSNLRFREGRVGVQLLPSGTDVRLEYSRVRENGVDGIAGVDRVQDSLELRVIQDLLRFEALGRWRLLMAFRIDALEDQLRSEEVESDADLLSAENRAVRAGLSVTF